MVYIGRGPDDAFDRFVTKFEVRQKSGKGYMYAHFICKRQLLGPLELNDGIAENAILRCLKDSKLQVNLGAFLL